MRDTLVTFGGAALALFVAVGTWLYVAGRGPEYPWNLWLFQTALLACTLYALALGRTGRGS